MAVEELVPHKIKFTRITGYNIVVTLTEGMTRERLITDDQECYNDIVKEHYYHGFDSMEDVLDEFHSQIPIRVLDDFDISVESVRETL